MAIIRDQSPSVNRPALEAKRRSLDEARAILRALFVADYEGTPRAVEEVAARAREGVEPSLSLELADGLLAAVRDDQPLDDQDPPAWLGHLLNIMRRGEDDTKAAAFRAARRGAQVFGLTYLASQVLSVEDGHLADEEAELRRPAGPVAPVEVFHFDGDALQVVVPEGEPATRDNVRVVIRHVSEALGVDFSSQLRNLKHAAWACVVEMTTQVGGQSRSVSTIPLKALPMWLARLNPGKVRPELRAKITRYQCEAADALAAHFLGTEALAVTQPSRGPVEAPELPDWRVLRERRLSARALAELARETGDQSAMNRAMQMLSA